MQTTYDVIACFAMCSEFVSEDRRKKTHEFLFGKQSKFLCLTRGCVLTFSRKKRIINTKRRRFVFFETTINVGNKEVQVYEKPHHYNKP